MKKENIPNFLTIIRFILVPFIFIAVVTKHYLLAVILFTISGITDILDGYIARKYNFITNFGKLMDPLADKLTQLSLLLSLSIVKILPWWIFGIVLAKELILIISACFLYSKKDVVVYSKWYGKLATVLFYLAIISSLVINYFKLDLGFKLDLYLYYLAIATTIFSLIMYGIKFVFNNLIKNKKNKENKETEETKKDNA